jgi:hypothetical protein
VRLSGQQAEEDVDFAVDSALEESGFELLVPLVGADLFGRNGTEITRVRERYSRIRAMTPIGFERHETVGERRC